MAGEEAEGVLETRGRTTVFIIRIVPPGWPAKPCAGNGSMALCAVSSNQKFSNLNFARNQWVRYPKFPLAPTIDNSGSGGASCEVLVRSFPRSFRSHCSRRSSSCFSECDQRCHRRSVCTAGHLAGGRGRVHHDHSARSGNEVGPRNLSSFH